MKLKTTEINGTLYAEVSDGKPLYTDDNGVELAFDAPGTRATISRLNGEAKGHREAKEAAEKALKSFEGLDADQAREALVKLSNIDSKKLIDAGEKDAAIQAAIKPFQDEIKELKSANNGLNETLADEMIGGRFSRSKFSTEKLNIPPDMAQAFFGNNFKIENGSVVGYDGQGNKLYSPSSPGNPANFDEALEMLVNAYPSRDHILKGVGGQGGGGKANQGSTNKSISRSEFDKLSPGQQMEKVKGGFVVDAT